MAKEAYYFSHDSNASNDPKIIAMRSVYGTEGYGRYWLLIEMMREADGHKLDMQSKYAFNAYAEHLKCDCNAFASYLHDCINEFQLFSSDGNHFWSESLLRRMKLKEYKSEKARQSAEARWGKRQKSANASKSNANASKNDAIKESKLKESIYTIFDYWNTKKIIVHRSMTKAMESKINARFEDLEASEIVEAIDNYYAIISDPNLYWYSHKFTLLDFMNPKNLDRFLTENNPFENHKKKVVSFGAQDKPRGYGQAVPGVEESKRISEEMERLKEEKRARAKAQEGNGNERTPNSA